MRGHIELWMRDGGLEVFGPYDATNESEFLNRARAWCRNYCRAGKVRVVYIHLGGNVVAAYRTRKTGGYQCNRGFRVTGALKTPLW